MKPTYIDDHYKCHVTNPDGNFREFDIPFFYDKCDAVIECYRYCPEGESYTNEAGRVYNGECIVLWKPYDEMDAVQRQYEREQMTDMKNALAILLGGETV